MLPPVAIGAGALVFLDSPIRHLRPLRAGVLALVASTVLALSTTDTVAAQHHGGLIGAYARTLLEAAVGGIGVSILVALGFLAAVVLITGASVGVMMRSSGCRSPGAAPPARRPDRRRGGPAVPRAAQLPADAGGGARCGAARSGRPGTARRQPGVRRPVRRRRPSSSCPSDEPASRPEVRPPRAGTADPEPAIPPTRTVTAEVVAAADAERCRSTRPTPMVYRLPPVAILKKQPASRGGGEDHKQVARKLVEALANFGVEARCVGMVSGPRVTRYELQLAPGIKVSPRVAAARRPGLRAGDDRDPDPGADPRQAGGRRRGAQQLADMVTLGDIYGEPPAELEPADSVAGQGHLRQRGGL